MRWFVFLAFGAMVAAATSAAAASRCDQLLARLGNQIVNAADTTCFESPDLTTANPNTTPAMDALLPINLNARAYERAVAAALSGRDHMQHQPPAYRLYEVQNGNHIETYKDTFPQLALIQPHAQHAFDLLTASVEHGSALPPDQCIPRGGSIATSPAQPWHCASLFVGP